MKQYGTFSITSMVVELPDEESGRMVKRQFSGWQYRYVSCNDGILSYYLSEADTEFGCRGSISLLKATIVVNEFDPCRFDVCLNDNIWYFRVADETERQRWVEILAANVSYEEETTHSRRASTLSISSDSSSKSQVSNGNDLEEKLFELNTFRGILDKHINALQKYFDACAHWTGSSSNDDSDFTKKPALDSNHNFKTFEHDNQIDFKEKSITFRAVTTSVQNTLASCVVAINSREKSWRKKLSIKEKQLQVAHEQLSSFRKAVKEQSEPNNLSDDENVSEEMPTTPGLTSHRFSQELSKRVQDHLLESIQPPGVDGDKWQLCAEEGKMKMYTRELIRDGIICDPLKAIHKIEKVTAREVCHNFWLSDVRKEWEGSVEEFRVLEKLDDSTVIIYQSHKRIWPSAPRDCLYLSSILKIDNPPPTANGHEAHDTWMVCNFSVDHAEANPVPGCVRATIEVALICQTYITSPDDRSDAIRDHITCDIVYVASINPGGLAPASFLRPFQKREYAKFLRTFTTYVQDKTKDKDVSF
ncbi:unnamed protein product [Clavelina lepadiformis]|uniref:Collagen type IV alpha-3-binding protein n=1 Tax=Clavelina lepadiformis TaxID=159417 RepID=A0ABP0GX10_CLALP